MGIFTKLSTVIKSNINDLISKAENPEKMLNQIILDMRDQLAKAKREVAGAIADERKLKSQLDDEVKQAKDWEQRAMLAVNEGRASLVVGVTGDLTDRFDAVQLVRAGSAAIGGKHASCDRYHRRLAGAVFANDGMHLASADL